MTAGLRIVHMASLARSGETLLLRTLSAHPLVHVVHDLHPANSEAETRLFKLLRVWPAASLPRWQIDQHIAPRSVAPGAEVLLIKQGVFAMAGPFSGFGLVRNPYASFCSLWSYDARLAGQVPSDALNRQHWQQRRLPRLLAWADACLPGLVGTLLAEADPVLQFLLFWQARVAQIVRQCETVVLYEDVVLQPRAALQRICKAAALPFEPALLHAERRFSPGQRGHGGIDLGQPIRATPAWALDLLVPLEPFEDAVERGVVQAYRGLYARGEKQVHRAPDHAAA